jgi:protein tyrosine phosphatase
VSGKYVAFTHTSSNKIENYGGTLVYSNNARNALQKLIIIVTDSASSNRNECQTYRTARRILSQLEKYNFLGGKENQI